MNTVKKTMLSLVDISKSIMYDDVHAQNEFLAITNATVSHELRNPLQSIDAQNIKIKLCLKELQNLVQKNKSALTGGLDKKIGDICKMIEQSNKIQDSSSTLMSFLVDDLLDFAQLNAGKFRQNIKEFDIKEAIDEVISIQKDKANMMGIKLECIYKNQIHKTDNITSLFNKVEKKEDMGDNKQSDEESDEAGGKNTQLCMLKAGRKVLAPQLIKGDQRRF